MLEMGIASRCAFRGITRDLARVIFLTAEDAGHEAAATLLARPFAHTFGANGARGCRARKGAATRAVALKMPSWSTADAVGHCVIALRLNKVVVAVREIGRVRADRRPAESSGGGRVGTLIGAV